VLREVKKEELKARAVDECGKKGKRGILG